MTDPAYLDLISEYVDHHGVDARKRRERAQGTEDLHTIIRRARAERSQFLRNLFRHRYEG